MCAEIYWDLAGAKQVIGIDAADIIDKARVIIKENQLDSVITLVKSKVEEAVLPVEKVALTSFASLPTLL